MAKFINIEGNYINPETVINIEEDSDMTEQFVRITTTGAAEGNEDGFEAHSIRIYAVSAYDCAQILMGKAVAKKEAKKPLVTADDIKDLF